MSSQPPRIGGGLFSKRPGQQATRPKAEGGESNNTTITDDGDARATSTINPVKDSNRSDKEDAKMKEEHRAQATSSAPPITLPKAAAPPSPQAVGTAESLFSPTGSGFLGGTMDPFTSVDREPNVGQGGESDHAPTQRSAGTSPPPPPPPPPEIPASPPGNERASGGSSVKGNAKEPVMPSLDLAEQRAASAAADSVLAALGSVIDSSDESSEEGRNKAVPKEQTVTNVAADGDKTARSGLARHPPAHRAPEVIKASSNPFGAATTVPQRTMSVRAGVTPPRYVNPFPEEMHTKKDEDKMPTSHEGDTNVEEKPAAAVTVVKGGQMKHTSLRHVPEPVKASSNPFGTVSRPRIDSGALSSPGVTSPRYVNPFPVEMHKSLGSPRSGVMMPSSPFASMDSGVESSTYQPHQALDAKALFAEDDWATFLPGHAYEQSRVVREEDTKTVKAVSVERDQAAAASPTDKKKASIIETESTCNMMKEKQSPNVVGERKEQKEKKEEGVSDDGHSSIAEPPKAAMVEPPKAAIAEPPKAAIAEPPKAAMVEPPKAAMVEPPKAAMVEPPKAAMVEPPKAAMVEPPKAAMAEHPKAVMVEPPKAAMAEHPKAAMVEPPKAAMAEHPKAVMVEPPKAAMAEPSKAAMVEPPKAATIEPPKAGIVEPPKAGIAEPSNAAPTAVPSLPIGSPGVPTAASLFEDSASPIDFMSGGRGQAVSFSSLIHGGEAGDTVPKQESSPSHPSEPSMPVDPLAPRVSEAPMQSPAPSPVTGQPPKLSTNGVSRQCESAIATSLSAMNKQSSDVKDGCMSAGVAFGFGGRMFEVIGTNIKSVPFPLAGTMEDLTSYPGPFTATTPRYVVQQYCHRMLSSSTGDEQVLWRLLSAFADADDDAAANKRQLACTALRGEGAHPTQDSLMKLCWAATDDTQWQGFVESETEEVDWACVLALASTQGADKFRYFMSMYGTKGLATANKDTSESPARPLLQMVIGTFTGQGSMDDIGPKTLDLWPAAAALLLRMGAEDKASMGLRRLGDSLIQAGRVAAADVCYVLGKMVSGAKHMFDPVDDPNAVMCMLLVDHRDISQLSRILQPQPLQASEVLEYLGNSVVEPSLVPFKFAYAQRLAECGLLDQASAYYQQVYGYMKSQPPTRYSRQLRSLVMDFGKRLDLHRKYVTEAELCASDYKLDESDYRSARIWSGIKSLAGGGGGSHQTTPESTWAKPSQPSVAPQQPVHQPEVKMPPPPVQVPLTARPPQPMGSSTGSQHEGVREAQHVSYYGSGQGGYAVHMDENANPFAHPTPVQQPTPSATHPTTSMAAPPPPPTRPAPAQTAQSHYGPSPATASRSSWSSGAPVHHTAPGPVHSNNRGYTTGSHGSSRDALPGSGSLVSPVASHAVPTGFGTSMASPVNPAPQGGAPYPPRQASIASPSQGRVVSPSSGPAHRLPSGAFSNAGMASPQPPSAGPQPTFFGTQQQPPYGASQDFMPPPGGRPPLIPPNQQWGARPPARTTARESHNEHHSDAFESAGKYLGGILGGLKSAVAGISESISGPSQPEGDPYALGEENTFYYDEVRKEWRQRGQPEGQISPAAAAAPPPPAAPLAPPPTGFAPTQRRQFTQGNYVDIMRFG